MKMFARPAGGPALGGGALMLLVVDMDQMLGKDFEEGLSSLKTIMETPPTVN